ncbi:MAG: 5-formyltetrahydrofolate cyclo-ligase [Thermaurantiacus tibetensis]|uniref:5-formyltetrahydrofolate cyclo-ligase n=1 Tax=Thermaurantiacus tibetensis TaxID=2759035 RepID=UPI00188FDA70|nr:5-formyltetrahydrofolate cyclo-ligase [Thermaurantiacus tibetensis]
MNDPPGLSERERLRRAARRARRAFVAALAAPVRRALEDALAARAAPLLSSGATVASYWPVGAEVDPSGLDARIGRLCFPRITHDGTLAFHACPRARLAAGSSGIPEPPPEAPEVTPDVLLVPLLLFDAAGGRLGQGGGHYDRALARLRAAGTPLAIGLAWDMQEAPALPLEPWDAPLDLVVTPTRLLDFRRARPRAGWPR